MRAKAKTADTNSGDSVASGELSRDEQARISNLSKVLSLFAITFAAALLTLSFCEKQSLSALSGILLLCGGGTAAGAWAGFLYSTFGQETDRFKGPFTLLNAAFGGAVVADISKGQDSLIQGFLRSTSEFCGFDGNSSPVVFALVIYTFGGFMLTYYVRRLLLNPAAQKQDNAMRDLEKASKTLANPELFDTDPGKAPELDAEQREAVEVVLKTVQGGVETKDSARAAGQAKYYKGEYDEAENLLKQALDQNADDPLALMLLAQVYLAKDLPLEAVPYLERAAKLPDVPPFVWKLLGYTYLWDETKLAKAESASKRYINAHPDDNGAKLNLACVYGQRGPGNKENKAKCLELLARVFENDPEERATVRALMKSGGDFEDWVDDPDFMRLVEPK